MFGSRFVFVMLLALIGFANTAWAGDMSSAGAPASHPLQGFATVMRISGEVTAGASGTNPPRQLQLGDAVYVGETVRASVSGEALLKTDDSGYMAVRPTAAFLVEKFAANHNGSDHISIRMFQGGLRLLTGWIGKLNAKGYKVSTPTATVGIRGTDHEPYVITKEMVATLSQPAGTYDKVNSGGTTLEAYGNGVEINPGKVGFVRLPLPKNSRALITLVLPVILDKVPGFYVAGQFDAELDSISASNEFGVVSENPPGNPNETVGSETVDTNVTNLPKAPLPSIGRCNLNAVAKEWVEQLDRAIARKDNAGMMAMFASDTPIRATVVSKGTDNTTLVISPEEFAKSATEAIQSLSEYKVRRLYVSAKRVSVGSCTAVAVESRVIEQGRLAGKPFRFETVERYQLEARQDKWVATQASTRQR